MRNWRKAKGEFGLAFCKSGVFKKCIMKKLSFQKVHNEKVHFQKVEYLIKAVTKCFLKKLSVWLALIKVVV